MGVEIFQKSSVAVLALLSVMNSCPDRRNTITGPSETIVTIRSPAIGRPVADFIFTQDLDSDDVSLVVLNVSQAIASFNYTINFSVSGRGWTNDGSVSMLEVGASEDKGIIAIDSPTIVQGGFVIVLSSVLLNGVEFDVEDGELSAKPY